MGVAITEEEHRQKALERVNKAEVEISHAKTRLTEAERKLREATQAHLSEIGTAKALLKAAREEFSIAKRKLIERLPDEEESENEGDIVAIEVPKSIDLRDANG